MHNRPAPKVEALCEVFRGSRPDERAMRGRLYERA